MLPFFVHPQLEEAWLDDEHSEFLEQLKMEMLEEQQREEMELAALQEEQENEQVRRQRDILAVPVKAHRRVCKGL